MTTIGDDIHERGNKTWPMNFNFLNSIYQTHLPWPYKYRVRRQPHIREAKWQEPCKTWQPFEMISTRGLTKLIFLKSILQMNLCWPYKYRVRRQPRIQEAKWQEPCKTRPLFKIITDHEIFLTQYFKRISPGLTNTEPGDSHVSGRRSDRNHVKPDHHWRWYPREGWQNLTNEF